MDHHLSANAWADSPCPSWSLSPPPADWNEKDSPLPSIWGCGLTCRCHDWVLPRPWAAELFHGVRQHGISAETVACGEGECGNRQTSREKDLRAQGRNAVLLACVGRFSRLRIQSGVDSPPLASEDCRMWYGHNWRTILGCCWRCFLLPRNSIYG